jgi:hypothetical protein
MYADTEPRSWCESAHCVSTDCQSCASHDTSEHIMGQLIHIHTGPPQTSSRGLLHGYTFDNTLVEDLTGANPLVASGTPLPQQTSSCGKVYLVVLGKQMFIESCDLLAFWASCRCVFTSISVHSICLHVICDGSFRCTACNEVYLFAIHVCSQTPRHFTDLINVGNNCRSTAVLALHHQASSK